MRARVAGLEAVLADGPVIDRRSGLLKDNGGYDVPALDPDGLLNPGAVLPAALTRRSTPPTG